MENPAYSNVAYSSVARWLHWLVAGLIVTQYVLAELAEQAGAKDSTLAQLGLLAQHKSVGITVLGLVLIRLLWRWRNPAPQLPQSMPVWQARSAIAAHWALYILLLLVPITGWLMSSASAYSVSWFNLLVLPDLVTADEALKELLKRWHEGLAQAMFIIALIHLGAVLKHVVFDQSAVLSRMLSWPALGAAVVLAGGLLVVSADDSEATEQPITVAESQPQRTTAAARDQKSSDLPVWRIDYANSAITFSGQQAGAPFTGTFPRWAADVQFDPGALQESMAKVNIDMTETDSGDSERDSTLLGSDFFNSSVFPTATFIASDFVATDTGYMTNGLLSIKQVALPVEFSFTYQLTDTHINLQGTARLDRLNFNVGTGDWQDTTWVGQFVDVHVTITAAR